MEVSARSSGTSPVRSDEHRGPASIVKNALLPLSPSKLINRMALAAKLPKSPRNSPTKSTPSRTPKLKLYNNDDDVFGGIAVKGSEDLENPFQFGKEPTDYESVEKKFELLLDSRGIPKNKREELRGLDTKVKISLIKNEMCPSPTISSSPTKNRTKTGLLADTHLWSPKRARRHDSPGKSQVQTDPEGLVKYLSLITLADADLDTVRQLRRSLQCERLQWLNEFLLLNGIDSISRLLIEITQLRWREERDDDIYGELMLSLKAICQFELGLYHISTVAPLLFPKLIGFLFSDKQPSGFSDRGLIITILAAYLVKCTKEIQVDRAKTILSYIEDPVPPAEDLAPDFIEVCHQRRPFKNWCMELSNVVRDVFWIFTHATYIINLHPFDVESFLERREDGQDIEAGGKYVGGVEWETIEYLAAHIDLLNIILALAPSAEERNSIRQQLKDSGFERLIGKHLRASSDRYSKRLHRNLETMIAFALVDGWSTEYMMTGLKRAKYDSDVTTYDSKPLPDLPVVTATELLTLPDLDFDGSGLFSEGTEEDIFCNL